MTTRSVPPDGLVQVKVHMPHLAKYNRKTRPTLTYSCDFKVKVGDSVVCPVTALSGSYVFGRVVAIGGGDYPGPFKALIMRAHI